MLKEKVIFTGNIGDDIVKAIPIVINKASTIGESVFLNWNGVTVRVFQILLKMKFLKSIKEDFIL